MKTGKSKVNKIISFTINILLCIYIAFSMMVVLFAVCSIGSKDGLTSIGNLVVMESQTGSMKPAINKGDAIFSWRVSNENKTRIKVGEIITFNAGDLDNDGKEDNLTHRIIDYIQSADGKVTYLTKGDNSPVLDSIIMSDQVLCKYVGFKLPLLGYVLGILHIRIWFILIIIIPLIAIIAFELVKILAMSKNKETTKSSK